MAINSTARFRLVSLDGRTVRVETPVGTLDADAAREYAAELQQAASDAKAAVYIHERHVDLQASCPLCRYEAGPQTDRLTREYEVTLTVENHDPSDEFTDSEPERLTFIVKGRDEQDAEGAARDEANGWVQQNWGDVGFITSIIKTKEFK